MAKMLWTLLLILWWLSVESTFANVDRKQESELIELPNQLELGKLINYGGFKNVYKMIGEPRWVALTARRKFREGLLQLELDNLEILKANGVPTAQFHPELETFNGRKILLMEKFEAGSKTDPLFFRMLNSVSEEWCCTIQSSFYNEDIFFDDLQFLINKSGKVVPADPTDVVLNSSAGPSSVIGALKKNYIRHSRGKNRSLKRIEKALARLEKATANNQRQKQRR